MIIFIYIYLIFYNPLLLRYTHNNIESNLFVTPHHMVSEWYLLPYYGIFKSIDNKILSIISMILSIIILIMIPLVLFRNMTNRIYRPLSVYLVFFWIFYFISLGIIGNKLVVKPYVIVGKYLVFINNHFYTSLRLKEKRGYNKESL